MTAKLPAVKSKPKKDNEAAAPLIEDTPVMHPLADPLAGMMNGSGGMDFLTMLRQAAHLIRTPGATPVCTPLGSPAGSPQPSPRKGIAPWAVGSGGLKQLEEEGAVPFTLVSLSLLLLEKVSASFTFH
jgi:hypothetical protein